MNKLYAPVDDLLRPIFEGHDEAIPTEKGLFIPVKLPDAIGEKYHIVTWPDVQDLMGINGFRQQAVLINDEKNLERYGSSAYLVPDSIVNPVFSISDENDRVLAITNGQYVYIRYKGLDIKIKGDDEGVVVDIYPEGKADVLEPIATTWVRYDEAIDEKDV